MTQSPLCPVCNPLVGAVAALYSGGMATAKGSMRRRQRLRLIFLALVGAVCALLATAAVCGYWFGWGWTGIPADPGRDVGQRLNGAPYTYVIMAQLQRTLWDWLQLLVVPAALAAGGLWFTRQQAANERAAQERRMEEERSLEQNRFHARSVQDYIDRMSALILDKGLRASQPGAPVRQVATGQTMTTLRGLDGAHKALVLSFLYGAELIGGLEFATGIPRSVSPVISMKDADLHGLVVTHAFFNGINLSGADMTGARLQDVNLSRADLSSTVLAGSTLQGVRFNWTELSDANLTQCKLRECHFEMATFNNTDLSGTDVPEADLTSLQRQGIATKPRRRIYDRVWVAGAAPLASYAG